MNAKRIIIKNKPKQNGCLFYIYSRFYSKKNQEEKHLFEGKEFKKLKSTDRNNQREKFLKDKLIFYPYEHC